MDRGMEKPKTKKKQNNVILINTFKFCFKKGVEAYIEGLAKEKNVTKEEAIQNYFKGDEPTSLIERFLDPKEISAVVVFLASTRASGITGNAQRVEGGIIRHI